MQRKLMAKKIKVHPRWRWSTFCTAELLYVKVTGQREVGDVKGVMKKSLHAVGKGDKVNGGRKEVGKVSHGTILKWDEGF